MHFKVGPDGESLLTAMGVLILVPLVSVGSLMLGCYIASHWPYAEVREKQKHMKKQRKMKNLNMKRDGVGRSDDAVHDAGRNADDADSDIEKMDQMMEHELGAEASRLQVSTHTIDDDYEIEKEEEDRDRKNELSVGRYNADDVNSSEEEEDEKEEQQQQQKKKKKKPAATPHVLRDSRFNDGFVVNRDVDKLVELCDVVLNESVPVVATAVAAPQTTTDSGPACVIPIKRKTEAANNRFKTTLKLPLNRLHPDLHPIPALPHQPVHTHHEIVAEQHRQDDGDGPDGRHTGSEDHDVTSS